MKLYSPLPEAINKAICSHLQGVELVENTEKADISLPSFPLPVKLGEVIDFIEAQGKNQTIGSLGFNYARKKLENIELTEKEADILNYLINHNSTASREDLIENVWGYSKDADTNTVESHIYRLRQKISAAFGKEIISSENGSYKLVDN